MAKRNKSALKANRQNIKRRDANRRLRSKLRTGLKSLRKTVEGTDKAAAKVAAGDAQSLVDRMAASETVLLRGQGEWTLPCITTVTFLL